MNASAVFDAYAVSDHVIAHGLRPGSPSNVRFCASNQRVRIEPIGRLEIGKEMVERRYIGNNSSSSSNECVNSISK